MTSVSFAYTEAGPATASEGVGMPGMQFWAPELLVGTADAFIVGVDALAFEELRAEDRRGVLLVQVV